MPARQFIRRPAAFLPHLMLVRSTRSRLSYSVRIHITGLDKPMGLHFGQSRRSDTAFVNKHIQRGSRRHRSSYSCQRRSDTLGPARGTSAQLVAYCRCPQSRQPPTARVGRTDRRGSCQTCARPRRACLYPLGSRRRPQGRFYRPKPSSRIDIATPFTSERLARLFWQPSFFAGKRMAHKP